MNSSKKSCILFICAGVLFALFCTLTAIILLVDVRPIGPLGSEIGLAGINGAVFSALGENSVFYAITEVLGYLALAVAATFAVLGLVQLIRRRGLFKIDREILLLAMLYFALLLLYVGFELIPVNFRPVLEDGELAASFPSSHTMLSVCIFGSAVAWLRGHLSSRVWREILTALCVILIAVTVIGRLLSGVHWLTDIVAAVLISSALLAAYYAACARLAK